MINEESDRQKKHLPIALVVICTFHLLADSDKNALNQPETQRHLSSAHRILKSEC